MQIHSKEAQDYWRIKATDVVAYEDQAIILLYTMPKEREVIRAYIRDYLGVLIPCIVYAEHHASNTINC
jgi:hypothetical protein